MLDGVWTLLPSPSHSKVNMKQGIMCLKSEDILQLLHYKYDIIKERLYREMLQDEYGERESWVTWKYSEYVPLNVFIFYFFLKAWFGGTLCHHGNRWSVYVNWGHL